MKPKYESHVKPKLDKIREYAQTMTEEQIAKTIGISKTSWYEYKKEHPEIAEAVKLGREDLVKDLKSTLIRKAKGFNYEEKKIIKEKGVVVREEIYIKASPPDVAALNLLLKNYDSENWANDPQAIRLREKELELKEKQIEEANW